MKRRAPPGLPRRGKRRRRTMQGLIKAWKRADTEADKKKIYKEIIGFLEGSAKPLSDEEYFELLGTFKADAEAIKRRQKELKAMAEVSATQIDILRRSAEERTGAQLETARQQLGEMQRDYNEILKIQQQQEVELTRLKERDKAVKKVHKEKVAQDERSTETIMNEREKARAELERVVGGLGDKFLKDLYWTEPQNEEMKDQFNDFPFLEDAKKLQKRYSDLSAEYQRLQASLNSAREDEETPIMRQMSATAEKMKEVNKSFVHIRNHAEQWMRDALDQDRKRINKELENLMDVEGAPKKEASLEEVNELDTKISGLVQRRADLLERHKNLMEEFKPDFSLISPDAVVSDEVREESNKWMKMVYETRNQINQDIEKTEELMKKTEKLRDKKKEELNNRIQRLAEIEQKQRDDIQKRLNSITVAMEDVDTPEVNYEKIMDTWNNLAKEKKKLEGLLKDLDEERSKLGADKDDALLQQMIVIQRELNQKLIEAEQMQERITKAKEDFDESVAKAKADAEAKLAYIKNTSEKVPELETIAMIAPQQARDQALKDLEKLRADASIQEVTVRKMLDEYPTAQEDQQKVDVELRKLEDLKNQFNERVKLYRTSEKILRETIERKRKTFLDDMTALESELQDILTDFKFDPKKEFNPNDETTIYTKYDWKALVDLMNAILPIHVRVKLGNQPPTTDDITTLHELNERFKVIKEDAEELPHDLATIQKDIVGPRKSAYEAISDDLLAKSEKEKIQKGRVELSKKMANVLEERKVTAAVEVYDKGLELIDWKDVQLRLRERFMAMQKEMAGDKSSYFPILSKMLDSILSEFTKKAQGYTSVQEQEFKELLRENLREALMQTGDVSRLLQLVEEQKLRPAASYEALRDYIMDPMSFSQADRQRDFMHSEMGLTLANSRTLLGLVQNTILLRQQYLRKIYPALNIEESRDAHLFDLLFTHCFPPDGVGTKLRVLRAMPAEDRAAYKNKPFLKALSMLDEKFDIDNMTDERFELQRASLVKGIESYLQRVCMKAGVSYETMLNDAENIERTKYMIYTQINPKVDDPERKGLINEMQQADGVPINDEDAGAVMQANGQRVSTTWNPSTQNQITRDQIDDVKKQTYEREVGKFMMWTMDGGEDEPYVPMHTGAAKYFFGAPNYENLKKKFDSMRPLIPKESIKNPSHEIEKILGLYGPILRIKSRKTSDKDHPVMIQQEAMELQELAKAYSEYTVTSEPFYNHTPYEERKQEQEAERQPENVPSSSRNIDPEGLGDQDQDSLTKGLFQDYESYYRKVEADQKQTSGFKNQDWLKEVWN